MRGIDSLQPGVTRGDVGLGRPFLSLRKLLNQLPLYTVWVGLRHGEATRAKASPPCYTATVGAVCTHTRACVPSPTRSLTYSPVLPQAPIFLFTVLTISSSELELVSQGEQYDLTYVIVPNRNHRHNGAARPPVKAQTRTCSDMWESHFLTSFGPYKHNRV